MFNVNLRPQFEADKSDFKKTNNFHVVSDKDLYFGLDEKLKNKNDFYDVFCVTVPRGRHLAKFI